MEMNSIYAILSVIIVSLVSIVMAIPLLVHKTVSKKVLVFLLSVSVGVLLGTVFLDFLPETFSHSYTLGSALNIIYGFVAMFALEKLIHWHHSKKNEHEEAHGHAYHIAPVNIIGDGIHNFIDGLVIAGAYAVSIPLGITATISVIFHEAPQEIADFGILLYSGLSKKKAVIFNLLSALTALLGAILSLFLSSRLEGFSEMIIPFAAGNFIYIAASNLVPQLHRHCSIKDTFVHVFAILLGVGIIVFVVLAGPAHSHG